VRSSEYSWDMIREKWASAEEAINNLYAARNVSVEAHTRCVTFQHEFGRFNLPLAKAEIDDLEKKRKKFVSFCWGIHYEIAEEVDNPFSVTMSKALESVYALNPSEVMVKTEAMFGLPMFVSLPDLMAPFIVDDGIRIDFLQHFEWLDKDEIPASLERTVAEARYWRDLFFTTRQCQWAANDFLTDDLRLQWPLLTPEQRQGLINDYTQRLQGRLAPSFMEMFWVASLPRIQAFDYGIVFPEGDVYGNYNEHGVIGIDTRFLTDATGEFSLDNLVYTVNLETYYYYQSEGSEGLYNPYSNPGQRKYEARVFARRVADGFVTY